MEISLPLDQMTTVEKLRVMEMLWVDLTRSEEAFSSPTWHEDVLMAREEKIRSGRETSVNWEAAKKQLRDRLL